MMVKVLNLIALLLLSLACGGNGADVQTRSIASVIETQETVVQDMHDKLVQIHIYQVIGLEPEDLEKIYKIQAVRTQVKDVEHKIIEIIDELKRDKTSPLANKKMAAILLLIDQFGARSKIHAYSVENLKGQLNTSIKNELKAFTKTEIEKEVAFLKTSSQYQVFEQNIEHLSFMLESRPTASTTKSCNLEGSKTVCPQT